MTKVVVVVAVYPHPHFLLRYSSGGLTAASTESGDDEDGNGLP